MQQVDSTNSAHPALEQQYRCYLGLGSNLTNDLGIPKQHIEQAVQRLKTHPDVSELRLSSLYRSVPLGPQDQPDFINAVVEITTTLSPLALLDLCQNLEQKAQRVRRRHWGERSLDVDVLLYDNERIDSPRLTVPHSGMLERNFVLIPLAELNSNVKIGDTMISNLPMSQDWSGLELLSAKD